jgi:DNA replication protein DnaC
MTATSALSLRTLMNNPGYNRPVLTSVGTCLNCGGTGFTIEQRDGVEVAVRCACRRDRKVEGLLAAARIPARYKHCTVENFEVWSQDKASNNLQAKAKRRTREFIDCYPKVERGLLYMGNVGTGKTHLAVAALQELILTKGAQGVYSNFLELVQELQMSFDGSGASREEILGPVTEADVLVLDELGAGRLTEWVRDLLYYVINSRYMANRVTIFTTNYLDFPQPARGVARGGDSSASYQPQDAPSAERGQETLADRISERLRSRLFEMCDVIELRGEDYRARSSQRLGMRS